MNTSKMLRDFAGLLLAAAALTPAQEVAAQPFEIEVQNCTEDQADFLAAAVQEASYALGWVGADLQTLINGGTSSNFEYWFGDQSVDSIVRVANVFGGVREAIDVARYDCGCNLTQQAIADGATPQNTMAWVNSNDTSRLVNLCPPFFDEDRGEFGGGALIHEFAHFGGASDFVSACVDYPNQPATTTAQVARAVAVNDPTMAVNNADNYRLYAIGWDPSRPTSWTCDEVIGRP